MSMDSETNERSSAIGGRPARERIDRTIRAEASAWIAKLHGPERSADLEEDFRGWLNARPEHARAFEHITEIWDALGNVNVGGLPRLASDDPFDSAAAHPSEPARYESQQPAKPNARTGIRETPARARAPAGPVAIAAAFLLAAIGVGTWHYLTRGQYTTDIGEQRIVSLDDGSRLYLNSDTRLNVDLELYTRRIELQRGEAYFEVAKDPTRPFIVTAGDRTVTALGTSFVVRHGMERTAVTLVEGKVTVGSTTSSNAPHGHRTSQPTELNTGSSVSKESEASAPVPGTVTLAPGQRITFERSGTAEIDTPRPEATAAWRRGEVVLDETPLASAIEEMNRYQRQRLMLDDAAIGDLPISGIYRTGNNQDFARAIATVYNLEVTTDGNDIHLRKK
jgi:transmembrane sensor